MSGAAWDQREWQGWLLARLSALLGRPVTEREMDRPLSDCGLSSRDAVTLVAEIGQQSGKEIANTLVWSAPTITALSRALVEEVDGHVPVPVAAAEPIAVVGLACRLPGAPSAEAFWTLLRDGECPVGTVQADRWSAFGQDVSRVPRHGAFLDDVAGFDAEFFGISAREADEMDPQQRLLLEVAWEALAHAGIPATSLHGSDCGVFVGLSSVEYGHLTMADLSTVDAWSATGVSASLAANRLSYVLGAHGPSVTVDTACSSSLVAVHQAARALQAGDCSTAVVGGVNLLLSPGITAVFDAAGALSSDGRCKPFDAAADGIVRGEGCGVVVLRRLADARRAGDRVLAVLRGSGVNSDGRSNGIMAPNPRAQAALLRRVYASADLSPGSIDYVEAHGTGTPLGDPIEAEALRSVLGRTAERPLLLGSVKSNLGHLEGAAGITGLIKVVLAMHHGQIPPSLHFTAPNPRIDFAGLRVVRELSPWPRYGGVARAGVSAFGFGGTNAHVVVEEWPAGVGRRTNAAAGRPEVFAVWAGDEPRLRERAGALARWLTVSADSAASELSEVAAALVHGCDTGSTGAVVVAGSADQLRERLRALAEGRADPSVVPVEPEASPARPVFVFSGYGSYWSGMGRRLLTDEPAFRTAVRDLDAEFLTQTGCTLTSLLTGDGSAELALRQPATFGMQVALAALWRAHGVTPAAVIGHSVGEVAAAVVSGALSPAAGLRVVVARASLLSGIDASGAGAMAMVELPAGEVTRLASRFPGIGVAVHASPRHSTVSGPTSSVDELVSHVEGRGGLARRLRVGGAGHSPAVDPILAPLRDLLAGLDAADPAVPSYSTVSDDPREPVGRGDDYWVANVRRPVRFAQAVMAALADGHREFVEISPHPIAVASVEQSATGVAGVRVLATLRRDPDGVLDGFAGALAAWVAGGHREVLRARYPRRTVLDLPGPVWRHRRHWTAARPPSARTGTHPWLGERVDLPEPGRHVWFGELDTGRHPWLGRRVVFGLPLFPAAGFVELAMAAARGLLGGVSLTGMRVVAPLVLSASTEVCVSAHDRVSGLELSVFARSATRPEWTLHALATATPAPRVDSRYAVEPERTRLDSPDGRVTSIGRVRVHGDPRRGTRMADGRLLDDAGEVLVEYEDVRFAPPRREELVAPPEMLCYQAVWQESSPGPPGQALRVVLLHDSPATDVANLFSGHDVHVLPLGADFPAADVVVVLASPSTVDAARDVVLAAADVVRACGPSTRLWFATSGAAAVLPGECGSPDPAALRGLVRVLAFEHPELHASWVDVDTDEALVAEVLAGGAEDEVAWRAGRRYVRRVAPLSPIPNPSGAAAPVVRAGAYVITGGLGGLGRVAARWLAGRGATRVVLSGRRPAAESFSDLGCEVRVVTGDIADPEVAERVVSAATEGGLPLRGVLHAAGTLSDSSVLGMSESDLSATWRAKTVGAQRLAAACQGHELDWWVAYSSAAGLFGSPGQAAYATANAWLDAFCVWLRGQGVPATTVQWGAWSEVGGAAANDNAILERVNPVEAMQALTALLAAGVSAAAVVRFDAARITELFPALARRPFIGALLPSDGQAASPVWSGLSELSDPATAHPKIEAHMRSTVAEMMRTAADRLDVEVPLTALGMDSLLAMRARAAIERDFGLHLPLPLLLRGASLRDLATHVTGELLGEDEGTQASPTTNGHTAPQAAAAQTTNGTPSVAAGVVGPGTRDFAERWVARMWREVLGDQPVGVHLSFDGDAAARELLLRRVVGELGATVSDADLFRTPTVAGMADLLRPLLEGHEGGAVRVLSGRHGGGDPLFLFHPAGGSTAVYSPLVALLGDLVSCLGFERLPELATVEEKADRYAALILERQPVGPYRLGGWSFGGCLAYETARRLVAAGHVVDKLFLVDTILPLGDQLDDEFLTGRFRRFVQYVESTYQVQLGISAEVDQLADDERFPLVVQRLRERVPGMGEAVLEHQYTSYVDARVAERYRPQPYGGTVVLFRAQQPHPLTTELDPRYLRKDRALGWDAYCSDLVIHDVPGDHISMVDPPNINTVAAVLREGWRV
jgi:phthiocerol/phenolphthiocerol synthesis type-I polyketide synthase D